MYNIHVYSDLDVYCDILKADCKYSLDAYPHGWLVRSPKVGGISMDAFQEIMALGVLPQNALIDPGIASALGGILALGTSEGLDKWRKSIALCLEAANYSPELRWVLGVETGLSSLCLFAKISTDAQAVQQAHSKLKFPDKKTSHLPADSADFGRCLNMLWHTGLNKTDWKSNALGMSDEWDSLIGNWDSFEKLYEEKKFAELGKLLDSLNR